MATLYNGINGPFKGVVGTVIGSSWKGKYYMKSRPKKRTDKVSVKEMANRKRFAISQEWLGPIVDFVRAGFKGYSQLSEGFVAAKSYLLKNAIEGELLDITVNPALVKVSHGDLPLPKNITVKLVGDDRLQFTWDTAIPEGASADDQVMLLAHNLTPQDGRDFPSYTVNGQFRHAGHQTLEILYNDPGSTYHIYFAMVAPDRSRQSDSMYLGAIKL